jgi:hypothetical protein
MSQHNTKEIALGVKVVVGRNPRNIIDKMQQMSASCVGAPGTNKEIDVLMVATINKSTVMITKVLVRGGDQGGLFLVDLTGNAHSVDVASALHNYS